MITSGLNDGKRHLEGSETPSVHLNKRIFFIFVMSQYKFRNSLLHLRMTLMLTLMTLMLKYEKYEIISSSHCFFLPHHGGFGVINTVSLLCFLYICGALTTVKQINKEIDRLID